MNLDAHTLKSYDAQLSELSRLIAQMVGELQKLLICSKKAFRSREESQIDDAKGIDKIINQIDQQIEEAATRVLALQNPLAVDLRFVTSVLKITFMLEQAGDLAKNTIKRSVRMGSYASEGAICGLEQMVDRIYSLLGDSLRAFESRDAELATRVWKSDDAIDALYKDLVLMMQKEMADSNDRIGSCTHVMFAAKNLERLADYATNLAKTVYYINTGTRADKAILKN